MTYTKALEIVLVAASIRRDQWRQCAKEGTAENCIEDLWNAGHDECEEAADLLTQAIEIVCNKEHDNGK